MKSLSDKQCQLADIQRVGKELILTMRSDPNDLLLTNYATYVEYWLNESHPTKHVFYDTRKEPKV